MRSTAGFRRAPFLYVSPARISCRHYARFYRSCLCCHSTAWFYTTVRHLAAYHRFCYRTTAYHLRFLLFLHWMPFWVYTTTLHHLPAFVRTPWFCGSPTTCHGLLPAPFALPGFAAPHCTWFHCSQHFLVHTAQMGFHFLRSADLPAPTTGLHLSTAAYLPYVLPATVLQTKKRLQLPVSAHTTCYHAFRHYCYATCRLGSRRRYTAVL